MKTPSMTQKIAACVLSALLCALGLTPAWANNTKVTPGSTGPGMVPQAGALPTQGAPLTGPATDLNPTLSGSVLPQSELAPALAPAQALPQAPSAAVPTSILDSGVDLEAIDQAHSGAVPLDAASMEHLALQTMQADPRPNADPEFHRQIQENGAKIQRLRDEIAKIIVGNEEVVSALIASAIGGTHILIESTPGTGKTMLANTFSQVLGGNSLESDDAAAATRFRRIQFTPDLMPSDITGSEILQEDSATGRRTFQFVPGPVFTNILLADEINRTPPKTQAALLEAMQEKQVTVNGKTSALPRPFFVMATENPIEQEGTYKLSEAQTDRFTMKVTLPSLPEKQEELNTIMNSARLSQQAAAQPVITLQELADMGKLAEKIHMTQALNNYIVHIVYAMSQPHLYGLNSDKDLVSVGPSARAAIALAKMSRIRALMHGRDAVTGDDIRALAPAVFRHRLQLNYSAETTVEEFIRQVLEKLPENPAQAEALKRQQAQPPQQAAAQTKASWPKRMLSWLTGNAKTRTHAVVAAQQATKSIGGSHK